MIEITVKAKSGEGKSTIASYLAKTLDDMGFDVVVDDSDEINHTFLSKERLQTVLNKTDMISIKTEQVPRTKEDLK